MVKNTLLYIGMLILAVVSGQAATDTMTGIFHPMFKSLLVRVDGDQLAPPIINLGSTDRIIVSFDELGDENSYLRYRVMHCNANWQPSDLVESEYVDGFNLGTIEDWDYSRMTTTHYVHYQFAVPNDDMYFLVSGNYLLQVYDEDDPDTVLLQARFMVSENTANVGADVLSVTDVDYNDSHQQVTVTVDATNAKVEDVYNDLMVYVNQNGRWDNEVMVRQPLRALGKTAYYEHLRPLIFDAGNEYRRFESVSTTYPGMKVEKIEYHDPCYHIELQADTPRNQQGYLYDQTQHGRYFIREYNSDRSEVEADYVITHFILDMPEDANTAIFLDGDFVARRFDPESMMTYNRATNRYEKTMMLKQGAYNYQYLAVGPNDKYGRTSAVEGDFYQTANEYLVKVYTRKRGERYDRLIGTTMIQFK